MYIHTNLNRKKKKHFPLFYPRNVSKFAFNSLLETNICESDYPRHAIVYIPTADLGQNLWETQARATYNHLPRDIFWYPSRWLYI